MQTGAKELYKNGQKLVWADDLQAYELALPVPGKVRMILDESTDKIVVAQRHDIAYRERKATMPDGTKLQETVVFAAPTDADIEASRLRIEAKQLALYESAIDGLTKLSPLVGLGVAICVIVFFYSVALALSGLGELVALRANTAMAEVAYYGTYLVGALLGAVALRLLVPMIFGMKINLQSEVVEETQSGGDVIINVQSGRGALDAQQIINQR